MKGTSHVITGLTDGVEYAVRVMARKGDAESAPSGEAAATPRETEPPAPSSASVDGATLTVTFDEPLDPGETPAKSAFAATVGDASRGVETVAVSGSGVTITLVTAVFANDAVTVDYTVPTDQAVQDLAGNAAASFSEWQVINDTPAADRLTATASAVPASHDGHFTFELEFSEEPWSGLSHKTLRDHAFTVTEGDVTRARRLDPPGNVGWEIHVEPDGDGAVTIVLPVTTDCTADGAICTGDRRPLSSTLEVTVAGPEEEEPTTTNNPATGAPGINGTVQVGEALTASTTGIQDNDGLTNPTFSYQWLADNAVIAGATASTYTPVSDDEGSTIRVRVSFTDDRSHEESLTSDPTGAVAPPPNTPPTGTPTISGTLRVGETLSAVTSGIHDADGMDNAVFAYQWLAGGAEINGATVSTYTLARDDEGRTIGVRVAFTDGAGHDEELTSAQTEAVLHRPNAPVIRGTARVGETLTADTGDISDPDGLENAVFAYQWIAGGADIEGATGSGYTVDAEDEGLIIQVWVGFDDDAGNPETRTSSGTEAVAPRDPPNTPAEGAPTLTGTARVGETLTVDTSGIRDAEGMDHAVFSYRWMAGGTDISGATGSTYTLTKDEEGLAIQVWVSFADDADNPEALTSAATEPVEPRANRPSTGAPTIIGTPQVGEVLNADTSGIADADGLDNAAFSYQWGSSGIGIPGATGSTYTISEEDEGFHIQVIVTFTDDAGNSETLMSEFTDPVASAPEQEPEKNPQEEPEPEPETPEPPGAPTGLSATLNEDGSITLTWTAPSGDVDGYQILRRRSQQGESELAVYVDNTGSDATTWTDTGTSLDTRYVYRVKARSGDLLSQWSNYARVDK